MIPNDGDELHALAGEYVLGVLEPEEARAIEAAFASNAALRRAVAFWEENLHPLSALAPQAEPPAKLWDGIAAQLDDVTPAKSRAPHWWNQPAPWRWTTGGFAAAAAALVLYIALAPVSPRYVAILHAPHQDQASFVATVARGGLTVRAVAAASPPAEHAFELWAIAPGAARPQALGVIPANGVFRARGLPSALRDGATLAISVEPPGGSPTQQPTGPVVFVGAVEAL